MAKKVVLKIIGMHCTSCAMNIDGDLEDTEGVKRAQTSYTKQECEIEFDEEIVTIEHIVKTVSQTGYQAKVNSNYEK